MRGRFALALSVVMLTPLVASAGPSFSFIGGKVQQTTILGGSQFTVEVNAVGTSQVEFVVRNNATTAQMYDAVTNDTFAVIDEVAFADGITIKNGFVSGGTSVVGQTGVDFVSPLGDLQGQHGFGQGAVPGFEATQIFAAADAVSPSPKYGIGAGEFLALTFDLKMTFDKLLKALSGETTDPDNGLPALRIGLHVQSIGTSGKSDVFVNVPPQPEPPTTATPEPASLATACMGVLMGLGYAWRRRKRAAA